MKERTERLTLNDCDRYETESGREFRSGDPVTVWYGEWIQTRMESRQGEYYLIGVPVSPDGLPVKVEW